MKKLLFLLMMAWMTGMLVTSCSKDDDNNNEGSSSRIVGTWVRVIPDSNNYSDSLVVEFKADGSYMSTSYEKYRNEVRYTRTAKGTYEYSGGSTLTITCTYTDEGEGLGTNTGEIKFVNDNAFMMIDTDGSSITYYRYGTVKDYSTGK